MRAEEIRELSDADLQAKIAELEEERFRLRFRSATQALENPMVLRTIRRDIARLKTIARERELRGTSAAQGTKNTKRTAKRAAAR